jgi:hypothetical protein
MDILLCTEINIPLPQNKTIIFNNWDLLQWIQLFVLFGQVFTCRAIMEENNKDKNVTSFYLYKQLGISKYAYISYRTRKMPAKL